MNRLLLGTEWLLPCYSEQLWSFTQDLEEMVGRVIRLLSESPPFLLLGDARLSWIGIEGWQRVGDPISKICHTGRTSQPNSHSLMFL